MIYVKMTQKILQKANHPNFRAASVCVCVQCKHGDKKNMQIIAIYSNPNHKYCQEFAHWLAKPFMGGHDYVILIYIRISYGVNWC